jgi:signal transduction histidine kinase/CheY-like chemotaxis protein
MHKTSFIRSVKGKIIIAAILACFALFLAWSTSKDAFTAMLNAFENVSAPNEKLRIVNELSGGIARIDQVQRARLLNNPDGNSGFFNETKKLSLKIDTLKSLYPPKSAQAKRLTALKKLLQDRDRLFVNYLKVREGLINNKSFSARIESLNDIVDKSAKQADSTVTTTEKKTSTTTVYPSATVPETTQNRGFFNKLFGKKKNKLADSLTKPYQIVNEELNVKHDTLAMAIQDSLLKGLGQTMKDLEAIQQKKSALFVSREAVLTRSSSGIMHQIVTILKRVETEVVVQTALNNIAAKEMVHSSVKRISIIMLAFVILTVLLVYFIMRDISRINQYRKELELAKDEAEYHALAKHRFLSNMSHEIRTPLQSIIGYAEMIKQQEYPQKKDLEAIYRSSGHLMQIVNEVLDYNRIISGKFSFASQVFDMQALLDDVVSVMRLQADKKNIALKTNFDDTITAFVTGDPFRLKQVLFNLLGNAIKFTQQGEVVLTVKGKQADARIHYHFDLTDTGIGLSAADIERVFNEFEQAGDEQQSRAGTGLGLPITKELIESQGGSITVKSKPGKGSSFIFDLQFAKAEQPVSHVLPASSVATGINTNTVWIIDDDPFILELCSRIFDNNKIPYRCFTSPHEILNSEWDPDVKYLLLDIRMPEMSGMELCRLLRKQVPDDVMIYALTAQALPGEGESVLQQGFNGLLMKPFRENELVALVNGGYADNNDIPTINIKAIEKMTFGDPEQTAKILARFAADSINDIKELKAGIAAKNLEKVLLLTHRIAGRTAQAGARELAEGFRLAEIELNVDKEFTENRVSNILVLVQKLNKLAIACGDYSFNETVL